MEKLVGKPQPGEYHILLAHFPRYFPTYAAWGADLTLSGHNHGGIIRLPGIGGLVGPDPGLFPKYDHGEFTIDGRKMIVSAGKIEDRPEINRPAWPGILGFVGAQNGD